MSVSEGETMGVGYQWDQESPTSCQRDSGLWGVSGSKSHACVSPSVSPWVVAAGGSEEPQPAQGVCVDERDGLCQQLHWGYCFRDSHVQMPETGETGIQEPATGQAVQAHPYLVTSILLSQRGAG